MTNTRPLEDAELEFFYIIEKISKTSRLFKAADHPEVARIISRAYSNILALRYDAEPDDEGDSELIRSYGDELAKVAKALQSI